MNEMSKQILVGVAIAAIAGVWAFASTRASFADVVAVEQELHELETDIEEDIEGIVEGIGEIKDTWHHAAIEQAEFRAQVREKLSIQ